MNGLLIAILLPFAGTTLGAACVFLMKHEISSWLQKTLTGFAAGVMVAATVWSLLIPSMEKTGSDGVSRIVPPIVGFSAGILFLLLLDTVIPHQHIDNLNPEGPRSSLSKTTKLVFAVTLHNLPEGMAVGAALATALDNSSYVPMSAVIALAVGIAIQNFPEGAIVSMPLKSTGISKWKSFICGTISGAVEPIGTILTILLASFVLPILPYMLAFAAGAMMYVVVEELIPETQQGHHSNMGTIGFAIGFLLMMSLDTLLS